jgi:hypothetical protein
MSAFGPKQTCASALHMFAFGGKADMAWTQGNVRLEESTCGPSLPPTNDNLPLEAYICVERQRAMSEQPDDQDRPCLHCMMVELIDEFFAEHPAAGGDPDTIDTDEVVTAIAKTVAELTWNQDGSIRQRIIEKLMREIMDYDAEFRRDDEISAVGSDVRH